MTEPADHLKTLARRVADAYVALTEPRAILLTGSVARGEVDCYSDLDLIAYYEALPSDEQLQATRERVGGTDYTPLGPRADDGVVERYCVAGVECQVAHVSIERWERDIAAVVEDLSLDAMAHKKLIGLLEGVPLHGPELIRGWQTRAAYPEELAPLMVEHYLRHLMPVWYLSEHLARRDAALWVHQMLVESAYNLLGVLAGLNRRYFSTFQLKRMRHLIDQLPLAPDDLAARLEGLLSLDQATATLRLEDLARETIALVNEHLPTADTSVLAMQPGARVQPWELPSE